MVTYRECETTRLDGRVTEKDKEYIKGRIRETKPGSREAERTYNRHGDKHPKSIWGRFFPLVLLGDQLEIPSTFAGQSLPEQVSTRGEKVVRRADLLKKDVTKDSTS